MEGDFFVMLTTQKGNYTPLLCCEWESQNDILAKVYERIQIVCA